MNKIVLTALHLFFVAVVTLYIKRITGDLQGIFNILAIIGVTISLGCLYIIEAIEDIKTK